ncbi:MULTISPECIES: hypothetical protein [unclassified Thiocapsa]|uniref:hypothetical protein n=1 Tax=unclassified Thiocapsa TaxID=2641286 RepID=UPI0035AD955B
MLHPYQFQVNEAWIAFKLNDKLVVRVPEDQLLAFIAEARDGFRGHFSMGGPW